ncbi:MAG: polysaccharide biosynthesis/export family protein [Rickettsiales bacterium]
MKLNFFSLVFLCTATIMVSGCTESASDLPRLPPEQSSSLKSIDEAPPPPPYLLQVGDTMDIKVRLNPELNESVIVPPDGLISTVMAEDVMAYGRSVKELRTDLIKQYQEELTEPHISVIMRSFAPNRVYVTGEVALPGEFVTAGPNLTLLQAIARAGGLKNSAGTNSIIIIRHGSNGTPTAYVVDYDAAKSGFHPEKDVRLAAYDVVFVPRSDVADVYMYFQQFVQQFLPASFGLSYQINQPNVYR